MVAACGGDGGDTAGEGTGGATETTTEAATDGATGDTEADADPVALIIAQGGLGDESYNDLAHRGFQAALESTGLEGRPIESDNVVAQGEQILRRAAQGEFGLVIDLEFSHAEVLGTVAQDFSDKQFAIVNTTVDQPNVLSVLFQEQQGSFLAGALAAMMTTHTEDERINEANTIGVIGGTKSTGIDKFIVGYIQGAEHVDENVEVLSSYTNDFGDPAKGRQAAQAMFEQGADIVYHVAGGTGAGVIEAAADANRYAIGVDTNQDDLAPGNVLTSMVKRVDVAVETIMEDYAAGELETGSTLTLGLEQDGVGLTDFEHTREQIPQEFLDRVEQLREQIIGGEIDVHNVIEDGYPDFYSEG